MTTDLSKQLGEIKRVWCNGTPDTFSPLDSVGSEEAVGTIQRLLHIIEVEIPGMLRGRADELDKLPDGPYDDGRLQGGIDELRAAALFIESLTKEKEKANG